jgi:hypothetical protein
MNAKAWFYGTSFHANAEGDPLESIRNARWCVADRNFGLTYQSCRFCHVSWPEVRGLFKYGVRHYICAACRERKLNGRNE